MNTVSKIFLLGYLFLGLTQSGLAAPETEAVEPYRIQPGDILVISVWKEEDLQRELSVLPDGRISFPLVNDFRAEGKTVAELREEIVQSLSRYVPDPVVTVAVKQTAGNIVYVLGKVNRPGVFPITRGEDVVQALAMAGGLSTYAAVNKIKILRRSHGHLGAIAFRYGDIEKGENLEQNIILNAGDVVLVP